MLIFFIYVLAAVMIYSAIVGFNARMTLGKAVRRKELDEARKRYKDSYILFSIATILLSILIILYYVKTRT